MIHLIKDAGIVCINDKIIYPYDNIEDVRALFDGNLCNARYGYNREKVFILEDSEDELSYFFFFFFFFFFFEVDDRYRIYRINIEPRYLSWNDVDIRRNVVKEKIKSILHGFNCKECSVFHWREVHYKYDFKNLIPSIEINYYLNRN